MTCFKVTPLWHFGTVHVSALNAQEGFTQFDSYFYDCYPNNIPLFLIELGVLYLFKWLGISNDYIARMLVNIGFVQLSLICWYVFIKRCDGMVRAKESAMTSIVRQGIILIPMAVFLPKFFDTFGDNFGLIKNLFETEMPNGL